MSVTQRIEIVFPIAVSLPPGFEQTLGSLIGMVCKQYERDHPTRTMWPAGHGAKPVWDEPNEPTFDACVYQIQIAERPATERERQRRQDDLKNSAEEDQPRIIACQICGQQIHPALIHCEECGQHGFASVYGYGGQVGGSERSWCTICSNKNRFPTAEGPL